MNPAGPISSPSGPYRGRAWFAWAVVVIGVGFVGAAVLVFLLFRYPTWFGLPASYSSGTGAPFGGVFLAFFLLVLGFFIVRVIFWSFRTSRRRGYGHPGGPGGPGAYRPERIARLRYARGEITREQFEQIMQDLRRGPGAP
jgi:uncharacterized membrane protein